MSGWAAVAEIADKALDLGMSNKNWNRYKDFTREQMQWQENMSNTAYQRAARDLEAAGLNRVLALGNSASTPSPSSSAMPQQVNRQLNFMLMQKQQQEISSAKQAEKLLAEQTRSAAAQADKDEVTKKFYEFINPYLEKAVKSLDDLLKGPLPDPNALLQGIFGFGNSNGPSTSELWIRGKDEIMDMVRESLKGLIQGYEKRRFGEPWDGKIKKKEIIND